MVGAVRGVDPETGHYFDDTRRYVDALDIDAVMARNLRGKSPAGVSPSATTPDCTRQIKATKIAQHTGK
jgi:hypothetical protein